MGSRIAFVAALMAVMVKGSPPELAGPAPRTTATDAEQIHTVAEQRGPEIVTTDGEGNQVARREGWAWVQTGAGPRSLRIDVRTVRVLARHGLRR